jgi:Secretion system C-terminal sorting domain
MKKLLIIFAFLLIVSPLWSHSIKFVAMDRYYNEEVPIDSILVHDMNTGEEKLYQTDSLFFETVSSVEEQTKVNSLHLYPNPVEDILNINTNSSEIIISDISGKVHYKSSTVISGSITLNVAGLPQGVYAFRSGNQTQTFIKNTPSNGQDVRLLSSSNSPSSLVKEAEVQSQFDYRFTIYSDGFKPKNYYTKALTKDTVVELDMSTITSAFDGKHIRVSIYVANMGLDHKYSQTNAPDYSKTEYTNYEDQYIDTLVIRAGKIRIEKYFEESDYGQIFDKRILLFEIDTLNQTISNFTFKNSHDKRYKNGSDSHHDIFNSTFSFTDTIPYNSQSNFKTIAYFSDLSMNYFYYKEKSYSTYFSIYYQFWKVLSYNPKLSYIKIEFID